MSRLDLVVFGATGFTGKYTVEHLIKISEEKGPFTWGVAGRNKSKLEKLLTDVGKRCSRDLTNIPVIIADVDDEESLNEMAKKAKVVINCCGPYRFYGEQVVKACVENKTHHVDVSGEPEYMERMQLQYGEKAKENGVYIISACGFDSIPADLGVIFLKNEFNGQVNSVETYLEMIVKDGGLLDTTIHYGTWESIIYSLTHADKLRPLRRALYPNRLPEFTPKLKKRQAIHKNDSINKWCTPFLGSDRSVVQRSQRFFFEKEKERPIQMEAYIAFPNFFMPLFLILMAGFIFIASRFEFSRKLLLKYPRFFSLGQASHEGPSEETMNNTEFNLTFFGEGWSEKLTEPTDNHAEPPNKKIVTKVSGKNIGYGATCDILVMAAVTILKESDKMPEAGGVLPPGAAFAKTNLIKELNSLGVKFEVVSRSE